jgi:hypothetical protein
MDIRTTITKRGISKYISKKRGLMRARGGKWSKSMREAKGLNQGDGTGNAFIRVYYLVCIICE